MNTIVQSMMALKAVEINADTEYAQSLGIEKGDIVFLHGFRNAEEGDLFLVEINGRHQLDTYSEAYTDLDEHSIGVLAGCLKTFKESETISDIDDSVLSAEIIGDQ